MKCYICDRPLGETEVKYQPEYGRGNFAPCVSCITVVKEMADTMTEEEISYDLEKNEGIETFDLTSQTN